MTHPNATIALCDTIIADCEARAALRRAERSARVEWGIARRNLESAHLLSDTVAYCDRIVCEIEARHAHRRAAAKVD